MADKGDIGGDLQVGPTDRGMVRISIVTDDGAEVSLDFEPGEAEDIAEELRAAAEAARLTAPRGDGSRN
jgi:hypothetical protein